MKRAELHVKFAGATAILGWLLTCNSCFGHPAGLYFDWSDLDDIHGDHRKDSSSLSNVS